MLSHLLRANSFLHFSVLEHFVSVCLTSSFLRHRDNFLYEIPTWSFLLFTTLLSIMLLLFFPIVCFHQHSSLEVPKRYFRLFAKIRSIFLQSFTFLLLSCIPYLYQLQFGFVRHKLCLIFTFPSSVFFVKLSAFNLIICYEEIVTMYHVIIIFLLYSHTLLCAFREGDSEPSQSHTREHKKAPTTTSFVRGH
jgi:hypothetical protein